MAERLQSIVLSGRRVEYRVQFSAGTRKSRIRVGVVGLHVVLPQGAEQSDARALLRKHAAWVLDQMDFFRRAGRIVGASRKRRPATILFRGHPVGVSIVRDESIKRRGVVENIGQALRVRIPARGTAEPMLVLEKWLRRRAREAISHLVAERSREIRRRPGRIFIMDQRTKWGNCSRRGNLSFNWRLIMAPPPVLDYVVVHELVHLAVPNHSSKFWLTLRSIRPDYEQHKTWLRTHQAMLRSTPSVKRNVEGRVGRLPSCLVSEPLI